MTTSTLVGPPAAEVGDEDVEAWAALDEGAVDEGAGEGDVAVLEASLEALALAFGWPLDPQADTPRTSAAVQPSAAAILRRVVVTGKAVLSAGREGCSDADPDAGDLNTT